MKLFLKNKNKEPNKNIGEIPNKATTETTFANDPTKKTLDSNEVKVKLQYKLKINSEIDNGTTNIGTGAESTTAEY